mmetsp:Transcript_17714/g.31738  ORF Transcript_17714/g.31738 Transcript_17714/m.31738 type:complete len:206 (-) Transcript_17714:558-1175(-)
MISEISEVLFSVSSTAPSSGSVSAVSSGTSSPESADSAGQLTSAMIIPPAMRPEFIESLRIRIPKNELPDPARLSLKNIDKGRGRSRKSSRSLSVSPLNIPPPAPRNSVPGSKSVHVTRRPLHQWKNRHVARWVKKVCCSQCARRMANAKVDGSRLLNVTEESDLVKLGFDSSHSRISMAIKDLQLKQTESLAWKLNASIGGQNN